MWQTESDKLQLFDRLLTETCKDRLRQIELVYPNRDKRVGHFPNCNCPHVLLKFRSEVMVTRRLLAWLWSFS